MAVQLNSTPKDQIIGIVEKARHAFAGHKTRDIEFRRSQLRALRRFVDENERLIIEALAKDLGKSEFESVTMETQFLNNEIDGLLMGLDKLTAPKSVKKTVAVISDTLQLQPEPYGVVLIIGPWNFPFQLLLVPLAGAIAAGNTVIVKPSECSACVANLVHALLPNYLDKECFHVINGGVEETTLLLKERFDYIFFTGGVSIGKIIYQAAAKHLTPVTLELGGKNPTYIDDSVTDLQMAMKRILWGRFVNAGQICIAPDYLMLSRRHAESLPTIIRQIVAERFGSDPKTSKSFGRIVNRRQFDRLNDLLHTTSGQVVCGGEADADQLYVPPTVVMDVKPDDTLMRDEIFGPILPVMFVDGPTEAIEFINRGEKPLATYVFATDSRVMKEFKMRTSSGGFLGNDVIMHCAVDTLPFGGVGNSGMGAYHGTYTFDVFSHMKPVLIRDYNPIMEALTAVRYPPYTDKNMRFMTNLVSKSPSGLPREAFSTLGFMMAVVGQQTLLWMRKILKL